MGIKRSGLIKNSNFDMKLLQQIWNLLFKSEYVLSEALELAIHKELDFPSTKLCNFVKESISQNRRGPMPYSNI